MYAAGSAAQADQESDAIQLNQHLSQSLNFHVTDIDLLASAAITSLFSVLATYTICSACIFHLPVS